MCDLVLRNEKQNCEDKFTEVASSPDFTFIGNVAVGHAPTHPGGQSVELRSLLRHYDAIVFAYGASKDRALGVPGESLKRIYSAREFVGWYNGLPEFANLNPDLSHEQAVIIGQGNVALDVTRILLEDIDKLRKTDIADYALEALSQSRVRDVRVVGRRGPMQAAFTIKELRELMQLPDTTFRSVDEGLIPPNLAQLERPRRRLMEVLAKGPKTDSNSASKIWSLDFCLSPSSFAPDSNDTSSVGQTTFQKTYLTDIHDPHAAVKAKGETIDFQSPMVFRSIGYKSEPLPEFKALGVPFDERKGIIVSSDDQGRVAATLGEETQGHFSGLYCAGWVKRGPTGVIASTMKDAFSTADAIAEDWKANKQFLGSRNAVEGRDTESPGWEGVRSEGGSELAKCVVNWDGWLAIDRAEKGMGAAEGKIREKITTIEKMLPLAISKSS